MLKGNRGLVTVSDITNITIIIYYSENETVQWGMNLTFLLRGWPASENVFRYWELAVEWNWWPSWDVDIIITLTLMMDWHQSSPAEFVTGPGLSERAETLSVWWTVRDVLHLVIWVLPHHVTCHMSRVLSWQAREGVSRAGWPWPWSSVLHWQTFPGTLCQEDSDSQINVRDF